MSRHLKIFSVLFVTAVFFSLLAGCSRKSQKDELGKVTLEETSSLLVDLFQSDGLEVDAVVRDHDGNGKDDMVITRIGFSGECGKDDTFLRAASGFLQGVAAESGVEFDKAVLLEGNCTWTASSGDLNTCAEKDLMGEHKADRDFCMAGLWKPTD